MPCTSSASAEVPGHAALAKRHPPPHAPWCEDRAQGCRGAANDLEVPLEDTLAPGPPAYFEGPRLSEHERGTPLASPGAREAGGRAGVPYVPFEGTIVPYSRGTPDRDGSRWDWPRPSRNNGQRGRAPRIRGGRGGYGRRQGQGHGGGGN